MRGTGTRATTIDGVGTELSTKRMAARPDQAATAEAGPAQTGENPAGKISVARAWRPVLLVLFNLAAIAAYLITIGGDHATDHLDLQVYRIGAQVWMHGGSLYGTIPVTPDGAALLFTYPPISAILFTPFELMPLAVAGLVLTVINVALVAAVLYRVLLTLNVSVDRRRMVWLVGLILPVALYIEPIRSTISYGQVNLILMALVVFDCLSVSPRWPRGSLIGLAAAIKLTPIVFVLYLLLNRDVRSAIRAVAAFVLVTGVGFLLAWQDSVKFWGSAVWDSGRVGPAIYAGNQSISGMLGRYDMPAHLRSALYPLLCGLVVVLAALAVRKAFAADRPVWALFFNALMGLLVSPIAWTHHWVWMVPGVIALWVVGRAAGARLPVYLAVGGGVMIALAPEWWLPHGGNLELRWSLWEQVVGSEYTIYAIAVLVLAVFSRAMWVTPKAAIPEQNGSDAAIPGQPIPAKAVTQAM